MGRIKTKDIKKIGYEILERRDDFTKDFASNKKIVKEMDFTNEKKTINKIAGFITRKKAGKQMDK